MSYTPRRDERFEYVWDVMRFVEDKQCKSCAFMFNRDDEYFMCGEIEYELMEMNVVPELDDAGSDGVVCTRYRSVDDYTHPDPLQQELF